MEISSISSRLDFLRKAERLQDSAISKSEEERNDFLSLKVPLTAVIRDLLDDETKARASQSTRRVEATDLSFHKCSS